MREKIKLVSTENDGHFYTTTKNKSAANKEKLELMKYNPTLKKHVLYKEAKMK